MTPLDQAHQTMAARPDDDAARLRFYERLAEVELFLLLKKEPEGDRLDPQIFPVEGKSYVLVFDRADRLAEFAETPQPYASLSGRSLAGLLVGQDLGLAVNPGVAPSAILLPAEAISWLLEVLGNQATETERRLVEVRTPFGIPEDLPTALDGKLAAAAGLADSAFLAGAVYDDGSTGILLAFIDAKPWAEPALTRGASEVVSFSHQAATLDVAFLANDAPLVVRLERVALKFDLPKVRGSATISAPGMDPDAPPRLR